MPTFPRVRVLILVALACVGSLSIGADQLNRETGSEAPRLWLRISFQGVPPELAAKVRSSIEVEKKWLGPEDCGPDLFAADVVVTSDPCQSSPAATQPAAQSEAQLLAAHQIEGWIAARESTDLCSSTMSRTESCCDFIRLECSPAPDDILRAAVIASLRFRGGIVYVRTAEDRKGVQCRRNASQTADVEVQLDALKASLETALSGAPQRTFGFPRCPHVKPPAPENVPNEAENRFHICDFPDALAKPGIVRVKPLEQIPSP